MRAVVARLGAEVEVALSERPTPHAGRNEVLVRSLRVGLDGTDAEIVAGSHGEAPSASAELVLGHEVVGVVDELGSGVEALAPGDLVTATVRRPDPQPCPNCRRGRPDLCLRPDYAERGIKGQDGFLAERFVEHVDYLVRLPDALRRHGFFVEPTSVVVKALDSAFTAQGARMAWEPRRAVVLGTGQIGLLATALLRLRDLAVWTLDRSADDTRQAQLVAMTGASHVNTKREPLADLAQRIGPVDLIVEGTGYAPNATEALRIIGPTGAVVLLSVTGEPHLEEVDAAAVNQNLVLGNGLAIGSVSSSLEHFQEATTRLLEVEHAWPNLLEGLADRELALEEAPDALRAGLPGLKTVVEFTAPE